MADPSLELPVMYIILNADLHLSIGGALAQVAHVVQIMTEECVRAGYETYTPSPFYLNYAKWKQNCTVIVKKASAEQMHKYSKQQNARSMYDCVNSARQQPREGSLSEIHRSQYLTAVGFFPGAILNPEVMIEINGLKLY